MKNIKRISIGIIMFFLIIINVYAELIPINKVSEEISKTYIISEFNRFTDEELYVSTDTINKKLNLMSGTETIATVDYTNEYIEYDDNNITVTEDNLLDDFNVTILLEGIMEALCNLNGYSNKTINYDEIMNKENSYEEYGFLLESKYYEFNPSENEKISGDHIEYFKISLDDEKIKKLITTYPDDLEDSEGEQENFYSRYKPTISAKNITRSTVMLTPKVE